MLVQPVMPVEARRDRDAQRVVRHARQGLDIELVEALEMEATKTLDKSRVGLGVLPPTHDIPCRIRRRLAAA